MTAYSIADARKEFSEVLNRAHYNNELIDITKHDKPYAFIGSTEDKKNLEKVYEAVGKLGFASVDELLSRISEMSEEK